MKNIRLIIASLVTASLVSLAALVAISLTSCGSFTDGDNNDINASTSYEVKVIDSCEYIYVSRRPYSVEFSLTHKGNCKFCANR